MNNVVLEGYILVPDENRESILDALEIHIQLTRQELGCITFEVTACQDDNNKFSVYEVFDDMNSFQWHQQRVKASEWGIISKDVTRYYQPVSLLPTKQLGFDVNK